MRNIRKEICSRKSEVTTEHFAEKKYKNAVTFLVNYYFVLLICVTNKNTEKFQTSLTLTVFGDHDKKTQHKPISDILNLYWKCFCSWFVVFVADVDYYISAFL